MPDYCTCGAELPPEALFCHKCGKPQREIQPVEPEIAQEPPPAFSAPIQEQAAAALPSFRNPLALRIAAVVALVATFLVWLPWINWLAGGFFAVVFYRRRTTGKVSLHAGLHLGWMTGVLMFAFLCVLIAGTMVALNAAGGVAAVETQLKGLIDPNVAKALEVFQTRSGVVGVLLEQFVMVSLLSMAGGLLGASMAPPGGRFKPRGGRIV